MSGQGVARILSHLAEHHLVEVPTGACVLSNDARTVMRHMNQRELDLLEGWARKQTVPGETVDPAKFRAAVLGEVEEAMQHAYPRPHVVLRPGTDVIRHEDIPKAQKVAKMFRMAVVLVPDDPGQEFCPVVTRKGTVYKRITEETRHGALDVPLDDALSAAEGSSFAKGDAEFLEDHERIPHISGALALERMPRALQIRRISQLARDKAAAVSMNDALIASGMGVVYRIGRRQFDYEQALIRADQQPSHDFSR